MSLKAAVDLSSGFTLPAFLRQWVEDKRQALACYAFIARVTGALKKVEEEEEEEEGRMHGRASAVAVWTELYCPGNLSVASPRSLFRTLPPTRSTYSPSQNT